MSPSVVCYPTPGKAKARRVLQAFAQGALGIVADDLPERLADGAAAFYGVVEATRPLWRQAREARRDWYYLDNSYFSVGRETFFRAARNALQVDDLQPPNEARAKALGIVCQPWQRRGRHIVVCPQSDWFMRGVCSWAGGSLGWQDEVMRRLAGYTERPVLPRPWTSNKKVAMESLRAALKGAHALVTHMSAAANEALLAGVPVFVTGMCAATPLASGELSRIESPEYPDNRAEWAAGLAGAQWTLQEMKAGDAWRALRA